MIFFGHNDTGCENDLNLKCIRLDDGYIVLTSGKVYKNQPTNKQIKKNTQGNV